VFSLWSEKATLKFGKLGHLDLFAASIPLKQSMKDKYWSDIRRKMVGPAPGMSKPVRPNSGSKTVFLTQLSVTGFLRVNTVRIPHKTEFLIEPAQSNTPEVE
jgi:hypothetical protein